MKTNRRTFLAASAVAAVATIVPKSQVQAGVGADSWASLIDLTLCYEVPATDIQLSGNTSTFMAGLHYTVVDGGEGLANDSITANDGVRQYPVRLLDGDITLHNPEQ